MTERRLRVGEVDPGDISPERREELLLIEGRYQLLSEIADDVVWVMAPDGRIVYVSPSVQRVRGLTPEEAMRQTLDEIHPPEGQELVIDYMQRLHAAAEAGEELPSFRGEYEYYRKDGSLFWGDVRVVPQVDRDGQLVELLGVTRDVTARREREQQLQAALAQVAEANEELERLAHVDSLTAVWNRRYLSQVADWEIEQARRYAHEVSLLVVDVDRFKEINDHQGHVVGDQTLRQVADRLGGRLRSADVLGRWGGDEFLAILPHTPVESAAETAEAVRKAVEADSFDPAGDVTITVGVAQLEPDETLDAWIGRADRALYAAKRAGRNSVTVALQ